MTNERYGKCDVCRYCSHSGDDWMCTAEGHKVEPKDSCGRYRPGFCENCSHVCMEGDDATCRLTGEEVFVLGVCDNYDPCARRTSGQ